MSRQPGQLIAFLPVFAAALSICLADDRPVPALGLADASCGKHEIDRAERVLHAVGMVLDAARVEEEARVRRPPPFGRLQQRSRGHACDLGGPLQRPLTAVLGDLIEANGVRLDEVAVDPAAIDHHVEHAGEQRGVASGLHGQEQVARARERRNARILDDDLCALLARLPDVVRRDRRAFGDVRAGDPDDVGADHVRPRVGRPVDAERFLVGCAGADHAQPSVVVDVRRLQAHPGELAEQVGLLGRQARAAQQAD